MKILIGIITFNPNIDMVLSNLETLVNFDVLIFDNNSINIIEIEKKINNKLNCRLIKQLTNIGISGALNAIFSYAELNGYEWVITFDQDSIIPQGFVEKMSEYAKKISDASILAPAYKDRNTGILSTTENKPTQVETCITSGSMTKVESWKSINGFDELLFIDFVDDDFCYRLRKQNKKIFCIPDIILDHQIGDTKIVKILNKKIFIRNHNAFRKYYICRNRIYLSKKYYGRVKFKYMFQNHLFIIKTLIFEKERITKLRAMLKGNRDGRKMIK